MSLVDCCGCKNAVISFFSLLTLDCRTCKTAASSALILDFKLSVEKAHIGATAVNANAVIPAAVISGVIPSIPPKSSVVNTSKKLGMADGFKPKLVGAGGAASAILYSGWFVKTTTYTEAAIVEIALRRDDAIPTTAPISCRWSISIPALSGKHTHSILWKSSYRYNS